MTETEFNFDERGQRLWESLLIRDSDLTDESNPQREIAISACRTADRVERVEIQAMTADPVVMGRGAMVPNPIFVEARNQESHLARLLAALRLPDEASGKRPQHRPVIQGMQQPSQLSALERARLSKSA